jgi:hypothetical protein
MSGLRQSSVLLVLAVALHPGAPAAGSEATGGEAYLREIGLPRGLNANPAARPVVVAIVDDAVRTSHGEIRPFLWTHPGEIPGNGIDDDGNGRVDDVHGWDVADGDADVDPPARRRSELFHGTHLAGIVARIAREVYGESAPSRVKILPVKTLSDAAQSTYLKHGFEGLDYAIDAGADVVLCAWGVGQISPREASILEKARRRGILVVAAAGNFPEGREQFPAADESVLAVAALDGDGRKTSRSNFGGFVDLSAPGVGIESASAVSDTAREVRDGTSQSAAIVAAAAALVKGEHPGFTATEVTACLKDSAEPVDAVNPRYAARLGAGSLRVAEAVRCDLLAVGGASRDERLTPQGYLRIRASPSGPAGWTIRPAGRIEGIRFRSRTKHGAPGTGTLSFFSEYSPRARRISRVHLSELPDSVYVPGTVAHVVLEPDPGATDLDWLLEYRAQPIDFSTLYCRGTVSRDVEGVIEDGSGPNEYSWNSDCKWLITAPAGKVVDIRFTEFDTEPGVDQVLLFDGAGTQEAIMARFSGHDRPPEIRSWRNQVLVWFVTDGDRQGRGWRAEYRFVDP